MDFNTSRVKYDNATIGIFQTSSASKKKRSCSCSEVFKFNGFSALLTNYQFAESTNDTKSPFEYALDYGSATIAGGTITPVNLMRLSGALIPNKKIRIKKISGFATNNSTDDVTFALVKMTLPINNTSAVTPTVLCEFTWNGYSNNSKIAKIGTTTFVNNSVDAEDKVFLLVKGSAGDDPYWNINVEYI
jgi:hypothetical protein